MLKYLGGLYSNNPPSVMTKRDSMASSSFFRASNTGLAEAASNAKWWMSGPVP